MLPCVDEEAGGERARWGSFPLEGEAAGRGRYCAADAPTRDAPGGPGVYSPTLRAKRLTSRGSAGIPGEDIDLSDNLPKMVIDALAEFDVDGCCTSPPRRSKPSLRAPLMTQGHSVGMREYLLHALIACHSLSFVC